ncbi:hypothetical protein JTB14_003442 [Gonioctena quinquepunctata]|nr:hypothetical protein JTB14_003442 [Gonioctena quinquepunctata]
MSFSSELSTDFCNGLNTKHFIREVQMRPAIWDTSCDDYNDRNKRKQCGKIDLLVPGQERCRDTSVGGGAGDIHKTTTEKVEERPRLLHERTTEKQKNEIGVVVPRKNAYLRKDLAKSLEDDSPTTVVKKEPHSTSISYESPYHETSNHSSRDPLEALIVKEPEIHPEDCDRLFLLSLVKPLKTIPEDKRFDVKMEMMQVIQNAQQSLRNNVMMMKFEGETSVNFDDDKSLDSIREPPTPVLSENNDSNDIENM